MHIHITHMHIHTYSHYFVHAHTDTRKDTSETEEGDIVPMYKKGSRAECGNYRGISLLSVVGKIYARVVCDRLRLITDAVLMDGQGGFRVHRGCVDQIFALRQVTETVIEN